MHVVMLHYIMHNIPRQAVGRNDLGGEGDPIHEKQTTSTMLVHIRQLKLITCNANQHLAVSAAEWHGIQPAMVPRTEPHSRHAVRRARNETSGVTRYFDARGE
jgi:hypothetical protein